ncbi:hypothetical protein SASPL_142241 [Salvia splendens]|uniref:Uncharacterized protein n=1 Tax=Salvia splendens TaxID=180675 RepID=A0A8X8Z8L1_SALSN|nr:hypothetical protein SASPL_142241 [Salvia splendens]
MAPYVTLLQNLHTAITNSIVKVCCVRVFGGLPDDNRDINTKSVFHDTKTDVIFLLADIIGVITSPGRVVKQSRYRLIEVEISDEQ